jgi:hypothetical protein
MPVPGSRNPEKNAVSKKHASVFNSLPNPVLKNFERRETAVICGK